jgi:16S rRNA (guanine(1405)-N(7))-methyltransferase
MEIGSRRIEKRIVGELIRNIKKKKEFRHLVDSFVEERLKQYLKKEAKSVGFLMRGFSEKSGKYKEIIKGIRRELRKVYGLFQRDAARRLDSKQQYKEILESHTSTRERLSFYSSLYKKIFKITGKPKSILDLGCGLNPFSIPFMGLKGLEYYAYDVNVEEMGLVKKYFKFLKSKDFSGVTGILDLLKLGKLKKVDVCFLWKVTDVLDRGKGHKKSEEVIVNVPAKYVIVSFPTFTVRGVRMRKPRRKWIELMCQRLGYKYTIIEEKNELFYVVGK